MHLDLSQSADWTLTTFSPGNCALRWRFSDLVAGQIIDLGDILLKASGTIAGQLLDAAGAPLLAKGWTVEVHGIPVSGIDHRLSVNPTAAVDPRTGLFELTEVGVGPVNLMASQDGTSSFESQVFQVRAGETQYVELRSPFPELASSIRVAVECPPYMRLPRTAVAAVSLSGTTGIRTTTKQDSAANCFLFDGLSAGNYDARVEDGRYEPWFQAGLRPGEVVCARLRGSARVMLSIQDATSRAPILGASVRVGVVDPDWHSDLYTYPLSAAATEDRIQLNLLPLPHTLSISAPGYANVILDGIALSPGQAQLLDVLMGRGGKIAGIVRNLPPVDSEADLVVHLLDQATLLRSRPQPLDRFREAKCSAVDRASGRFLFEHLASGSYVLQASASRTLSGPTITVDVTTDGFESTVTLELPAATRLRGTILAPAGAGFDGLRALAVAERDTPAGGGVSMDVPTRQAASTPVSAQGRFVTPLLPVGSARIRLLMPASGSRRILGSASTLSPQDIDLGVVQLQAGPRNEHSFDLRQGFPGTVKLTVRCTGNPTNGFVAELCMARERYLEPVTGIQMTEDQPVLLGPVPPGEYEVLLRALDGSWNCVGAAPVLVASGRTTVIDELIHLVEGTFTLERPGGVPTERGGQLLVRTESRVPLPRVTWFPDVFGRFAARIPVGRYQASFGLNMNSAHSARSAVLNWPMPDASAGVLVLPE